MANLTKSGRSEDEVRTKCGQSANEWIRFDKCFEVFGQHVLWHVLTCCILFTVHPASLRCQPLWTWGLGTNGLRCRYHTRVSIIFNHDSLFFAIWHLHAPMLRTHIHELTTYLYTFMHTYIYMFANVCASARARTEHLSDVGILTS